METCRMFYISWILFIWIFSTVSRISAEVVLVQLSKGRADSGAVYKGALMPNGLSVEATPLQEMKNVKELVYDSQNEQVYWIDGEKRTINAAFTDGSNYRTLYTLSPDSEPNCLALDASSRVLYYADSGENVIGVVSVDEPYHYTLLNNLDKPSHLVVDTKAGFLYWVMTGSAPGIYKGPTCGTRKDGIVTENVQQISGLAIGKKEGKIYWSDSSTGRIEEATLDGLGRKVLWEDTKLSPRSLNVGEDGIYFVDENTRQLYRYRPGKTAAEKFFKFLRKREAGEAAQADEPTGSGTDELTEAPAAEDPTGAPPGERVPDPAPAKPVKQDGVPAKASEPKPAKAGDEPAGDAAAKPAADVGDIPKKAGPVLQADPVKVTPDPPPSPTTPPPPLQQVKVMGLVGQTMVSVWTSIVRGAPGVCGQDNGQCSHICLPHPVKNKVCACPDGMTMNDDKQNCVFEVKFDPKKSYLVFTEEKRGESEQASLCAMELTSGHAQCTAPTSTAYGPVEINSEAGKMYWVDNSKHALMSSQLDGKRPRTLFRLHPASSITDIKINGISQLLYLADSSEGQILEADIKHPYAKRPVKEGLEHPWSIQAGKYLFWTEWSGPAKIMKAELEEGNVGKMEVLVDKDIEEPMALQFDYSDMSLYWLDVASAKVERLELMTKTRTTIYSEDHAVFSSLALDDKFLYVTDWDSGFIKRIEKGGNHKMDKKGSSSLGRLSNLIYYKPTVQDKDTGFGECGELAETENSVPLCYKQGALTYCRAGCKKGFEHLPSKLEEHMKLYTCMEGKWTPTDPLPNCLETIKGKGAQVKGTLTFITTKANCTCPKYRKVMAQKARMIMLSNHYQMCSERECVVKDPRVTCEHTGEVVDGEGPAKVRVRVVWRVMKAGNDTVAALKDHLSNEMYHLVRTTMSVIVHDVTIPVNLKETFFERPTAACNSGEKMTFNGCVACEPGSFYEQYSSACTPCPIHTYQDQPAGQKCMPCPNGTFGNITGASNVSQCVDLDLPTPKVPLGVFPDGNNTQASRSDPQGSQAREIHLIVGIVLFGIFFIIFLIILVIIIRKRRRRSKQEAREKWASDRLRHSLSDILKSSQMENGDAPHPEDSPHYSASEGGSAPLAEEEETFIGESTPNLLI